MKHHIKKIAAPIIPWYHWILPRLGAIRYGFPAKKLTIIAVTGTKGKSSTTEFIASMLRASGAKVAVSNSVRFVIDKTVTANTMRMSTPGRFFLQKFLHDAHKAGCTYAVIETTSEGARYFRHHALNMNALVFTNLAPEHIESHGSFEYYKNAKLSIVRELARSSARPRILVVNGDDEHAADFLNFPVDVKKSYSLKDAPGYAADDCHISFMLGHARVSSSLPGEYNLYNMLAAATLGRELGLSDAVIAKGLGDLTEIPGRSQFVREGQSFDVVVDYAHTAESLEALYKAFGSRRKIAVLGKCGGGRDKATRPKMAGVAEKYCDVVILTDEDPYDEDPRSIVDDMVKGLTKEPTIIMDRRKAIAHAISIAQPHDVILLTGKGTDPCICRANGTKEPWNEYEIAREAVRTHLAKTEAHMHTR
jgi:UDP-N-acetylmuramoyl-L-alanyl-D-glutamate--2,6-diaminopimelate ligase